MEPTAAINVLPPRQTRSRTDDERQRDKQAARDKRIVERESARATDGRDHDFKRSRAEQAAVDAAIERERQRIALREAHTFPEMRGAGGAKVAGDRVVRAGEGDGNGEKARAESFDCWRNGVRVIRRLHVD